MMQGHLVFFFLTIFEGKPGKLSEQRPCPYLKPGFFVEVYFFAKIFSHVNVSVANLSWVTK